jgi:hypothetical protein
LNPLGEPNQVYFQCLLLSGPLVIENGIYTRKCTVYKNCRILIVAFFKIESAIFVCTYMWLVLAGSIRVLLDTKFRRLPVVDVSGKLVSISMMFYS